jgi:hypothetical protein
LTDKFTSANLPVDTSIENADIGWCTGKLALVNLSVKEAIRPLTKAPCPVTSDQLLSPASRYQLDVKKMVASADA